MKLNLNLKNQHKIELGTHFTWKTTTRSYDTRIDRDWLILVGCIATPTLKFNYLAYLSSAFKISRKKNKKCSRVKNFHQFCESTKGSEYFVLLEDKKAEKSFDQRAKV